MFHAWSCSTLTISSLISFFTLIHHKTTIKLCLKHQIPHRKSPIQSQSTHKSRATTAQKSIPSMEANANGYCSSTPLSLLDRVAIVTGASRGIGKAISLHLASLGAKLVINYTSNSSQSSARELASQINSASLSPSPSAAAFQADVSDPAQVKSLFDFAEETFGAQPHILIANAAITNPKFPTIANTDVADFDRVFSVNARGTFLCLREASNRIVRGGGGRIVTVSTSLVAAPCGRSGAYTPSKAAVELMTKVAAKELRGTGITANVVAPGPIATDMFYIGKTEERIEEVKKQSTLERLGQVEDVAPLVGFLVSDAGEWVNGQVLRVNGGFV